MVRKESKRRRKKRAVSGRPDAERDAIAWSAHERFLSSGIVIRDVYRKLDPD